MCGIIGYTGKNKAVPYLVKGLQDLEYRGYDSAGIAVMSDGEIGFCKCKGRVSQLKKILEKKDISSLTGIGHTRWATHGEPSMKNAHPHLSMKKRFAVVHNGIIENYIQLKSELSDEGYIFTSETDTEVIPNLLEKHYNGDVVSTVIKCAEKLQGSFALAILCKDFPNEIICIRKGNPLVLCQNDEGCYLSSDITALLKYTDTVYKLQDGCPAIISENGIEFFDCEGRNTTVTKEKVNWSVADTEKTGYEHFMLKEIMEQPSAVGNTVDSVIKSEFSAVKNMGQYKKIHIVACGSAYHVAVTGKYVFESLSHIPCECHIASEFRYAHVPLDEKQLCIIISQSGETADSLAALRKAKSCGAFTLSIVNVQGSSIAAESDAVIYTKAGPEIAVATTKAYSAQLSVIYLIGAVLCGEQSTAESIIKKVRQLPRQIENTLTECDNKCKKLSTLFEKADRAYFIGRNTDYPCAMEGALKMKEISYIHCEAYAAGELKHGTISLIENGTVVVAVMTNERLFSKTLSNVKEVQSRGASVIFITKEKTAHLLKNEPYVITVPDCDDLLTASINVIPLQLLSYYTAKKRGCDIDKPRNLAKSVTVE